jgi:hypothetical protein
MAPARINKAQNKAHAETRRRGDETELSSLIYDSIWFMGGEQVRREHGTLHEPENVGIHFQRLTRSHLSPLIPLPFEGRGNRDVQSSFFVWPPARQLFQVMGPMHAKIRKRAFHEPENVRIDFQRFMRSQPSPRPSPMNPEKWLDARPHLGPLPLERMNHSPLASKSGRIKPDQGFNARTFSGKPPHAPRTRPPLTLTLSPPRGEGTERSAILEDSIRYFGGNASDDGAHRSDAPYLVGNAGRRHQVQGFNARTFSGKSRLAQKSCG